MPTLRFIKLEAEEDARLREIEQDSYLKPKVRLRAQVLRLSNRGATIEQIAAYTSRSRVSVGRDFDRWKERGFEGLADEAPPGNPPRLTEEVRTFMRERLSEEQRTWNATQLAEAVEECFGVGVSAEAIRQHLHSMGYSWKRTRYVPSGEPDPEEEEEEEEKKKEAREELEELKKGLRRVE
jgi:transposase